jgi:hypothetical protein
MAYQTIISRESDPFGPVVNDETTTERVRKAAAAILGPDHVGEGNLPVMRSKDFPKLAGPHKDMKILWIEVGAAPPHMPTTIPASSWISRPFPPGPRPAPWPYSSSCARMPEREVSHAVARGGIVVRGADRLSEHLGEDGHHGFF